MGTAEVSHLTLHDIRDFETCPLRLKADSVEVIDNGPGLSEEDAANLFQRGYRGTHAGYSQGGGIGLSIVRRLCDLYGWDVRVRPGDGRGVVAQLTFG